MLRSRPDQLEKMQQNLGRNNLIEIISILDENERKVFEDYASIFKDYVKKYGVSVSMCTRESMDEYKIIFRTESKNVTTPTLQYGTNKKI